MVFTTHQPLWSALPARFSWAIIVWRVTISSTVASAILGFTSIAVIASGAAKLFKGV
jgi:uncharacterized membrane protein YtjA (UPF0391 family)